MCSSWAAIPGVSTVSGILAAGIPGRESARREAGEPVVGLRRTSWSRTGVWSLSRGWWYRKRWEEIIA